MENATGSLNEAVDSTRLTIADALEGAASTAQRNANGTSANVEQYARKTAETLGATAGYLRTHDARQMFSDAEYAAKENPVPALITAAAVGFLLGALIRR